MRAFGTLALAVLIGVGVGVIVAGKSGPTAPSMGLASTRTVTPDQPIGLAVSRSGDLYIGDRGSNQILEWMPSGRFRIVAGTGVDGLTGDGGPAERAEVDAPSSLVIAPDGTLYFAQTGRSYPPANSSSGETFSTAIREITPRGTIRTVAGLHPSCSVGIVQSVPAESALFDGASLSLSSGGALAVEASLCENGVHDQGFGPELLLTPSGRFIKDTSDSVPAVASIDCGSGVPGPGFHVYGCESGGGDTAYGHGPELLVVRSDGSSVAYPDNDNQSGDFAVGGGEVVATYDGNLVQVASSRLIPLLANKKLLGELHLQKRAAISGIGGLALSADGNIYFVASIVYLNRAGCQSRILERTAGGALRQIWSSATSRNIACF